MAAIPDSTTLYFGPWYRKSPYFEATLRAGCSAYDVYNHTYLPAYYDDPAASTSTCSSTSRSGTSASSRSSRSRAPTRSTSPTC